MPAFSPALDQPAQYLKGVGPKRAEAFARLGVRTARDLLYHVPRRYEDASTVTPASALQVGRDATVIGRVTSKGVIPTRKGLRIFQAVVHDGTSSIECAWPGQPFLDRVIRRGDLILVTGPVRYFHSVQLQPREHVVLEPAARRGGPAADEPGDGAWAAGKVLPIYPATEGLPHRVVRSVIQANLDSLIPHAAAEEVFRPELLRELGLPPVAEALAMLHRPETLRDAERGRRRLAFEELFFLQLLHARARDRNGRDRKGIAFRRTDTLVADLYRRLPFELTGAQARALREIFADMSSERRMNRLLQGDVGSGKTVVALLAALLAAESGYQTALMAPTELLAEQHVRTLRELLDGMPVGVALLTGGLGAGNRRRALGAIGDGSAAIAVGTHALIQEGVSFHRLGLVLIDEQHRFGVKQRMALTGTGAPYPAGAAGPAPDVLVMSATPIPRSLALTLHGDLDLSVLDEQPPGRTAVRTGLRSERARERAYEFIREQARLGRQAYIVYPLVAESDKLELRAATAEFERLDREIFAELRLGLIHGQLTSDDKDTVMRAFAAGELDVLVSTSVIEVGIDVPNATVMLIEHADRFGLSQLHQLRGRVGRGDHASYCVLLAADGSEARERLSIMASTNDGFEIARADLRLRGMGDFFGSRQHGLPEFRFFEPERDELLIAAAREHARSIVAEDPELASAENSPLLDALRSRYGEREHLYDVG